MMLSAVLLDTSFFLRFLNDSDPLFKNADGYYRFFLQKQIIMMVSTISIAEYCVGGDANELPLRNLQIVPFNLDHAKRTGEFVRLVFQKKGTIQLQQRNIIPNDSKLFAQADIENSIGYYLSSDVESLKVYNLIKLHSNPKFNFIDLRNPYTESFGVLDV